MKLLTTLMILLPVFAFASEEAKEGTDIVARLINFVIFAGILYYLIADKVKEFFTGRTKEIADKLTSIQDKVEQTKELKQNALKKLEDAKKSAEELVVLAEKEAKMQVEKLQNESHDEIENLKKTYIAKKEILEKNMTAEVVSDVVENLFNQDGISLNEDELVNIINKKVA